jgi:SAM-dependent methyltransferase
MFVEESVWIRETLQRIDLPRGGKVLDVGSSTREYRTVKQPHVEENVMRPLRERGLEITHVDAKRAEGVDVAFDLDAPGADLRAALDRTFDLVICASLLLHVQGPQQAIDAARAMVGPGGYLLVTTPWSFRRTLDPHDNMIRPSPAELARLAAGEANGGLTVVADASVRIERKDDYTGLGLLSRFWVPIAGRWWLSQPGFMERLRYLAPRLRWKVSCVLLRRPTEREALTAEQSQV